MSQKRRPPRPTLLSPPQTTALTLTQSTLFTALLATEKRIDTLIARRKQDVQDTLSSETVMRKGCIYVAAFVEEARKRKQNKANEENEDEDEEGEGEGEREKKEEKEKADGDARGEEEEEGNQKKEECHWILRIEGKVYDPVSNTIPLTYKNPPPKQPNASTSKRFTQHFEKIVIEYTVDDQAHIIEYRPDILNPTDGFELKKSGNRPTTCKIMLHQAFSPSRYQCNPKLAELIGETIVTRKIALVNVWRYIKTMQLQDSDDKRIVRCDLALQNLFEKEQFLFGDLNNMLLEYLSPLDPITIDYTLPPDVEYHTGKIAYEIEFELDDPNKGRHPGVLTNEQTLRDVAGYDEKITSALSRVSTHQAKYEFLSSFAAKPVEFIQRWSASQSKDLDVIFSGNEAAETGDGVTNVEVSRKSGFYQGDWIGEGVWHYLNAKG